MKQIVIYIILSILFRGTLCLAQTNTETKEELLKQYYVLDSITRYSFLPEKMKNHTEEDVSVLLNNYYKEQEILSQIEGEEKLKFFFHKTWGVYFKWVGLYNESNNNYHLAYNHFYKIKDSIDSAVILHGYLGYKDLADNYITLNKIDSATVQYVKAIKYAKDYNNSASMKASAFNNIGIHFLDNLKQLDSAMCYFKKAMAQMRKEPDKKLLTFTGSIRDNLANAHLQKGNFAVARQLFHNNYEFYNPKVFVLTPDYERWFRAGLQIAETDLRLGAINLVDKKLIEIQALMKQYTYLDKPKTKLRYYNVKEDLHQARGEHRKAYIYTKKIERLQDSLERSKAAQQNLWDDHLKTIALIQVKKTIENKQLKQKARNQKKKFWLQLVMAFLMSCSVIFVFVFTRYRQRIKNTEKDKYIANQQLKMLDLKKELLEKEIELNKNDLSRIVTKLSEDQVWTKALLKNIKSHKNLKGREKAQQLKDIEAAIQQRLIADETIYELNNKIGLLSKSFYEKLERLHPELTTTEIKLAAMIRLGIDIHEVALLQNINTQSIHQNRYRLKKKLNLKKEQDLDVYLKHF